MRILVGFAAGGTADLMARLVADKMKDTIGQPVIVENRPGAAGRVAADAVKAAPADGTTIMVMPIGPMAVVPHTTKLLSFDPLKDFAPIGIGSTFDFAVAVGPQSGAKTWSEFVAWAKANPGEVRRTRRRAPAACRISSACRSARKPASTWSTLRTRAPQRTRTI